MVSCNKFISLFRIFPTNSQNKVLIPYFDFQSISLSKDIAPNTVPRQIFSLPFIFLSSLAFAFSSSKMPFPYVSSCLNLLDKNLKSDNHVWLSSIYVCVCVCVCVCISDNNIIYNEYINNIDLQQYINHTGDI